MRLPDRSIKMKRKILVENEDYYIENGRWVFTEAFHLDRGFCCGNACRHCPYEHINVTNKAKLKSTNTIQNPDINLPD